MTGSRLGASETLYPGGARLSRYRWKFGAVAGVALCVLGAHAALNWRFPKSSDPISYCFFLSSCLIAVLVCGMQARRSSPSLRRSWLLLTGGFLLWFTATVLAAYAEIFAHTATGAASLDDFFYFFSGIPILMVIASSEEGHPVPLFFWFDGIQAAIAGYVTYVAVFSVLPFSSARAVPLPVERLIWILDSEAFVLAALSTVRVLATARGTGEHRLFRILTGYLWASFVFTAAYNHLVLKYTDAGILDVLADVPFWVFSVAALTLREWKLPRVETRPRKPVALFIDHARPVVLGLALVAICGMIAQHHFKLAIAVIFLAFPFYGLRSAVLQSRFAQAQAELEKARDRLENLALLDGLTGVPNRRCFDQRFAMEWNRSRRKGASLSLLMVDIDHFKALNDGFGHLAGDECLIQVAKTLHAALGRAGDLLARYGGEEFVALLPETDAAGARNVAERLQTCLRETTPIPQLEIQVTVSVGVTTCEWHGEHLVQEDLVDVADRALYLAKQNGRDRVEFLSFRDAATSQESEAAEEGARKRDLR